MAWFRRRHTRAESAAAPAPLPADPLAEWTEQAIFVLMAHCEHLHDQLRRLADRMAALEAVVPADAATSADLLAVRRDTVRLVADLAATTADLNRDVTSLSSLTRQVALAQVEEARAAVGRREEPATRAAQAPEPDGPAPEPRAGVVLDLTDAGAGTAGTAPGRRINGNGALHPEVSHPSGRVESA